MMAHNYRPQTNGGGEEGGVHGWGSVHGWGVCMAIVGVWLGGMHGHRGCVAGGGGMHGQGCAWWGGMHGGVCVYHTCPHPRPDAMRYSWSMSGWYASYWNAFLLLERTSDILTFYI